MADPRWLVCGYSDVLPTLSHVMYLKGNIFRSAIFTPSSTVIASMLSMLRGKRPKVPPPTPSVSIRLACVAILTSQPAKQATKHQTSSCFKKEMCIVSGMTWVLRSLVITCDVRKGRNDHSQYITIHSCTTFNCNTFMHSFWTIAFFAGRWFAFQHNNYIRAYQAVETLNQATFSYDLLSF